VTTVYIEELPTSSPGVVKFGLFPERRDGIGELTVRELWDKEKVRAILKPEARTENACLLAFYFVSAKHPKNARDNCRPSAVVNSVSDSPGRYIRAWRAATDKFMRKKLYPSLLSQACSQLEDAAATPRLKFEIKVGAYCADRMLQGDFLLPDEDYTVCMRAFVLMASLLPRRRPIVHDWEVLLITGWISNGYYKMDRHELAAAVNPLIDRKFNPNTSKYYVMEAACEPAQFARSPRHSC
jgi:hypothetical protein